MARAVPTFWKKQQKRANASSTVVHVVARSCMWWHGLCQASSVCSGLETSLAWIFLHQIFIFSATNIILDPFLLESSLKPFIFPQESIFSPILS